MVDYLQSQLGEDPGNLYFLLHLRGQPAFLLLQSTRKEDQPGLPVRCLGTDRGLRLAQGLMDSSLM